jgi:hypothetical protein
MTALPTTAIAALLLVQPLALLSHRHDVDEARHVELGQRFPSVVQVGGLGSGTLIGREWVLTAAHVPEMLRRGPGDPLKVSIAGKEIEVAEVHVPDLRELEPEHHDIALLHLAGPAPETVPVLSLSEDDVEPGTEIAFAGWGILARGDQGVRVSPEAMAAPTRALRAGKNRVERVDLEAALLISRFDAPDDGALDLEAGPCIGDSGGPALVSRPGKDGEPVWEIAGVMALINDTDNDRIVGEYGEEFGMTMVAFHADWIRETMGQ